MASRKIESGQQRPHPSGPSSRLTNDFNELVWQNGQVTMQGPLSHVTRAVNHSLPPDTSRSRDSRLEKFSGVESILDEMPPILVPSPGLDLSQDDEMVPWIEALTQDYNSLLLPEVSGVRTNPVSTYNNSLLSSVSTLHSDGGGSSRARLPDSLPPPQHPSPRVSDAVGSGVSGILRNENSTNNNNNVIRHNHQDVVNDSNGVKNMRNAHNGSNYLNFSHFARPANLMKARASSSNEKAEVKEKGAEASGSTRMKSALIGRFNSVSSAKLAEACPGQLSSVRTVKESCPAERTENLCQEKLTKNDKPLVVNSATDSSKWLPSSENVVEPVVASSSVGSGNSADRVSSERRHTMKRKFCDAEDSECRSDDVETESVGVRKGTLSRGGGSKRSRAAEVHNLSERRRRDRINEKMRALQELIPNCNKADKASMLDEAIEYLKSLQLQVQIMSMGAGRCMPQMMFPTGMQHMHHPPHMSHLSSMGMGMNMSFGMGMMDMNGGFPISHFHNSIPVSFQRLPGSYPSWYGHHPGQVLPNAVTGQPPLNPHMGLSNGGQNTVPGELANMNQQLNCNTEAAGSIDPKSVKPNATNEVLNPAVAVQDNKQTNDAGGPSTLTSAKNQVSD